MSFGLLGTVHAQENSPSLIQNIEGREKVSLDGQWYIIIDPYKTGMNPSSGYMHDHKMENRWDRIEYNIR